MKKELNGQPQFPDYEAKIADVTMRLQDLSERVSAYAPVDVLGMSVLIRAEIIILMDELELLTAPENHEASAMYAQLNNLLTKLQEKQMLYKSDASVDITDKLINRITENSLSLDRYVEYAFTATIIELDTVIEKYMQELVEIQALSVVLSNRKDEDGSNGKKLAVLDDIVRIYTVKLTKLRSLKQFLVVFRRKQ